MPLISYLFTTSVRHCVLQNMFANKWQNESTKPHHAYQSAFTASLLTPPWRSLFIAHRYFVTSADCFHASEIMKVVLIICLKIMLLNKM